MWENSEKIKFLTLIAFQFKGQIEHNNLCYEINRMDLILNETLVFHLKSNPF